VLPDDVALSGEFFGVLRRPGNRPIDAIDAIGFRCPRASGNERSGLHRMVPHVRKPLVNQGFRPRSKAQISGFHCCNQTRGLFLFSTPGEG
jgi:hypothetical protein